MKLPEISLSRILFLLVMLAGLSCKKDDTEVLPEGTSGGGGGGGVYSWGGSISLTVSGVVDDEDGKPVAGAQVVAGNLETTTDEFGIFVLKNAPAWTNLGYVQVKKTGYFNGSRSFVPLEGGSYVQIRLIRKIQAGIIKADSGGSVSIGSGAELSLAPGIVSKNSQPYNGIVKVFLQHIDPTSADYENRMPGDLIALDSNSPVALKSFGMLAAELTDEAGQELQITPGKKAEIKFPLSGSVLSEAPDSIDLWHFDEENGYWIKEGKAVKENNYYRAAVGHFSYWNADVPYKFVMMKGRVIDNGSGLGNARTIISSSTQGARIGWCNAEGRFGGFVPRSEPLILKIEAACGGVYDEVYSKGIGALGGDYVLNNIELNTQNASQVTVKVTGCFGVPIQGTYVAAGNKVFFPDANGTFTSVFCGDNLIFTAMGLSPWKKGSSDTISLNGSPAMVNLEVCGNNSIEGTVIDRDGNEYNTITIEGNGFGPVTFMQENLRVTHYNNGNLIPTGLSDTAWINAVSGAYSNYNNVNNHVLYGKLYNWFAVHDSRGLCPAGWHIPSDDEWKTLENILGGSAVAGGKLKNFGPAFDGSQLWNPPNSGASNLSGFSGFPGGCRNYILQPGSSYYGKGETGYWWSSDPIDYNLARNFKLNTYSVNSERSYTDKHFGFSVRCFKD